MGFRKPRDAAVGLGLAWAEHNSSAKLSRVGPSGPSRTTGFCQTSEFRQATEDSVSFLIT